MFDSVVAIVESVANLFAGVYDGTLAWIGIDEDHALVDLALSSVGR